MVDGLSSSFGRAISICSALTTLPVISRNPPRYFGLQPVMQRLIQNTQRLGHGGDRLPSTDKRIAFCLNSSVYRARTGPVI